jgi:hypothetical protein
MQDLPTSPQGPTKQLNPFVIYLIGGAIEKSNLLNWNCVSEIA